MLGKKAGAEPPAPPWLGAAPYPAVPPLPPLRRLRPRWPPLELEEPVAGGAGAGGGAAAGVGVAGARAAAWRAVAGS